MGIDVKEKHVYSFLPVSQKNIVYRNHILSKIAFYIQFTNDLISPDNLSVVQKGQKIKPIRSLWN